jgi:tricarballylate dehydrogenase
MVEGHPVVVQRVVVAAWVEIATARLGGALRLSTALRSLLTDGRGVVVGVVADGPEGPLSISADAVVLATGGFGASRELLQRYVTPYADSLWARNSGFVTGDGLTAATAVGAAPSDGGFASFYGHCLPARPARFTREELLHLTQQYGPIGVALNVRGERYTDEGETRMEETMCVDTSRQPDARAFYVVDHRTYQDYLDPMGPFVSQGVDKIALASEAGGVVLVADDLGDLTDQMASLGVPAERARRTLETYNNAAAVGKAHCLDVPKSHFATPLSSSPYYAVMVQAGVTATYGGLKVNPNAQVIARTGYPIPGLYAAGIDVGNVNNRRYAGAWSLGLVFGRIAGQQAARRALASKRS